MSATATLPAKPEALAVDPGRIPSELQARAQWVVWDYVWKWDNPKERTAGKWTKILFRPIPARPNGTRTTARTNYPQDWGTYADALRQYEAGGWAGIGYVFSDQAEIEAAIRRVQEENEQKEVRNRNQRLRGVPEEHMERLAVLPEPHEGDSYCGVDLDRCIDPASGVVAAWAEEILRDLGPCYVEFSPSGTGLKAIIRGRMPRDAEGKAKHTAPIGEGGKLEVYDALRFFALTGRVYGEPVEVLPDGQAALERLYARFLVPKAKAAAPRPNTSANGKHDGDLTDPELWAKMFASEKGHEIRALYRGDMGAYDNDHSRADAALCAHLAWWTNRDAGRIDRMFRQCELYREKWEREDYRTWTIDGAIALIKGEGYSPSRTFGAATSNGNGHHHQAAAEETVPEDPDPGEAPPPSEPPTGGKRNQATEMVELALGSGAQLFHTAEGEKFATVPVKTHWETWPLKSTAFREWLGQHFYQARGKAPGGQAMQDAINTLGGIARYDRPQLAVFTRIAEHQGAIFLNLCDEEWRVVKVTPAGWELAQTCPVKFWRPAGMLPLPAPQPGGKIEDLRPFVNVRQAKDTEKDPDDDWRLVIGWLLGALMPRGPYALAAIRGEQGAAKTTTARALQRLIDPNKGDLRSEPKEARDLAISAKNCWLLGFDNLSGIPGWLSDALCRLSTGGGLGTRRLHTDDEEAIFDVMRPAIWTGISDVAFRSDLIDRIIVIELPNLKKRQTERAFWKAYEEARPRILGALLDGVAAALRNLPSTDADNLPRMADFCQWVTAAETALGWKAGSFAAAYERNRRDASNVALESSLIGPMLIDLVTAREKAKEDPWTGSCKELLTYLESQAGKLDQDSRNWPNTPEKLRGVLKRLAPNLRAEGIEVEFLPRTGYGRPVRLSRRIQDPESKPDSHDSSHDSPHDGSGQLSLDPTHVDDSHDGCDGSDPPSPSAYIPPGIGVGIEGKDTENGAEGSGLEEGPGEPSQPSDRHGDPIICSFCGGEGRHPDCVLAEAQGTILSAGAARDWAEWRPRGGIPIGPGEDAWRARVAKMTLAQAKHHAGELSR